MQQNMRRLSFEATDIGFTPYGSISATDVQGALEELIDEVNITGLNENEVVYKGPTSLEGDADFIFNPTDKVLLVKRIDLNRGLPASPDLSVVIAVRAPSGMTGITQQGVNSILEVNSLATNLGIAVFGRVDTQAASFTVADITVFNAANGTTGAGSTVTRKAGFLAQNMTGATTVYSFRSQQSAGANNWALYMEGTAKNYLAGTLLIGTTTDDGVNKLQVNGFISANDGTTTTPGFNFNSETGTGFRRFGSNTIAFTAATADRLAFGSSSGAGLINFAISGAFSSTLLLDASNALALRNAANAQLFRIYNTFTDSTNYERGFVRWNVLNSNTFEIGTEAGGTGTGTRSISFITNATARWYIDGPGGGHFKAITDNTLDIGAISTQRPRNVYIGNLLFVNTTADPGFGNNVEITGGFEINRNTFSFVDLRVPSLGVSTNRGRFEWDGNILTLRNIDSVNDFVLAVGSADVRLVRESSHILGMRNGTNPQSILIYNTFTDSSNYERLRIQAGVGNTDIFTQQAGTGLVRSLRFGTNNNVQWFINTGGNFLAVTDATNDIGALNALRPRDLHLSRRLLIATATDSGDALQITGNLRINSGNLEIRNAATPAPTTLAIAANAGINRDLAYWTGTTNRWLLRTNTTAESGANAGSNFQILAMDDAGSNIDTTVSIVRAAGGLFQVNRPTILRYNPTNYNAGSHTIHSIDSQGAGDAGGTTDVRGVLTNVMITGTNNVNVATAHRSDTTVAGTAGTVATARIMFGSITLSNAMSITTAQGIILTPTISGAGNIASMTYFIANTPSVTSTGNFTGEIRGFQTSDIGRATATSVAGFHALDQTSAGTANYGFRSALVFGSGKWNFFADGTASNHFAGDVRVGGTTDLSSKVTVQGNATGATTKNAFRDASTIQSDVTVTYRSFTSDATLSTQATAFTLTDLVHFYATNFSLGAGSTVTNQYGFRIGDLISAGNNYGLKSEVTSGTNKWNIYADGTAKNFIRGDLTIGDTADTTARFNITATGNNTGTSQRAILLQPTVDSTVATAAYTGVSSFASLSGAGSIVDVRMFNTSGFTIGSASVTNWIGYDVFVSTLTGPTNVYGFRSRITTASGRWNIYIDGTADNHFAGNLVVGTVSPVANKRLTIVGGGISLSYAAGTIATGVVNLNDFLNTYTGDPGGLSNVRGYNLGTQNTGANAVDIQYNLLTTNTHAGSATIGQFTGIYSNSSISSTGNVTNGYSFMAFPTITSTGSFLTSYNAYFVNSANITGAGTIAVFNGLRIPNVGHANVTDVYAVRIENITLATGNIRGIFSSIASGTNKWNIYADGSALNHFNGSVLIGTTTDGGFKLDVASNSRILGSLTLQRDAADQFGTNLLFRKGGDAGGAGNAIDSGAELGYIDWHGFDGSVYGRGALLIAYAEENWTTTAHGGRIEFRTTPIGSTTAVARMYIRQSGEVVVGDSNVESTIHKFRVERIITTEPTAQYAARSLLRMQNTSSNTAVTRAIGGNIVVEGSATVGEQRAFDASVTVSTAVTVSNAIGYLAFHNVTAAATITNLYGYWAATPSISGSPTISNYVGFVVSDSTAAITTIIGFSGNITVGTGKWNLHMSGSAHNFLAGDLRIGTTTDFNSKFLVAGSVTGGTTRYAIRVGSTIRSDVTTEATLISTAAAQTEAVAFTVTNAYHFQAGAISIGAGSAITHQHGFYASGNMTTAANNYGFRGELSDAAGRWNIYMGGTANNYIAGKVLIGNLVTPTIDLMVRKTTVGGNAVAQVYNDDNTNAASHGILAAASGGASGGDPYVQLGIVGIETWSLGVDNSDSDNFKISKSAALGSNDYFTVAANGSVIIGALAPLATNATTGFLYIPTSAGTPTGVPTAYSGKVAMEFDTTNDKLYVYDGSWIQINAAAGPGGLTVNTVEINLGSTLRFEGTFTITDAGISGASKLLVWQAPGPYTGKGSTADVALFEPIYIVAVLSGSGSATVYWKTMPEYGLEQQPNQPFGAGVNHDINRVRLKRRGLVKGNVKFNYIIG